MMGSLCKNKDHSSSGSASEEESNRKDVKERDEYSNHLKVKDECKTKELTLLAGFSAGEVTESLQADTDGPKGKLVLVDQDSGEGKFSLDDTKVADCELITTVEEMLSHLLIPPSEKDLFQNTKVHQVRRVRTKSENDQLLDWIHSHENENVAASLKEDSNLRRSIDDFGRTLLHISAECGNLTATNYVLDIFDVDARDSNGRTALMLAVEQNHANVVKMLLSAGSDIDVVDNEGKDVLRLGFANDDLSKGILALLLRELSKRCANSEVIAEKLISRGGQMHQVVYAGDVALVKSMLAHGADVDAVDSSKRTALHTAVILADSEIAKVLLENGADARALDIDGVSPLFCNYTKPAPGNREKLAILDLLLARKVPLTTTIECGLFQASTTLSYGCAEAIARLLRANYLDFGAVDAMDNSCPIHYLASNCNRGVAQQLRLHAAEHDYRVNASDRRGFVALHRAVTHGNVEMLQFLLEHGSDANRPFVGLGMDKYTPIYFCTEERVPMARECLEILLQHKANPQASVTFSNGQVITLLDLWPRSRLKPVLAHLVMIQRQGEPIAELISKKIDSFAKLQRYYNRCQSVLDIKLLGFISIFKLLTDSDKMVMGYLSNAELRFKLKKLNHKLRVQDSFSYYFNTLRKRVVKLLRLKGLREEAAWIFCSWFENRLDEKHIVIERILDFLDVSSLEQLISS